MKLSVLLVILLASILAQPSRAQRSDGFTCEKIKEKKVRTACISDREKANIAAKEKAVEDEKRAEIEKHKHAEIARIEAEKVAQKKELDDFVVASKKFLTKEFKDPFSVHYRDTYIIRDEKSMSILLCGSVNSKNSYGAYIGFKYFYVLWENNIPLKEWVQEENAKYKEILEARTYLASLYKDKTAGDAEREAKVWELKQYTEKCTPQSNQTQVKIPDSGI